MATPYPNPGPTLKNPALAMQMAAVNSGMTRAHPKGRSRATGPSSSTFSPAPPLARPDSAIGFQPAPFTDKTNTHEARQPALPRSTQPRPPTTIEKPTSTSTTTSFSSRIMPSRSSYAPHNRNKNENDRPTFRNSNPDGEQWRTEEGNVFAHDDRDAPHTFLATLHYDDTEPVARAAPVCITAPSTTNNIIKAAQADMMKENARLEKEKELKKQKEQEEKDAGTNDRVGPEIEAMRVRLIELDLKGQQVKNRNLAREAEEREAMEDAARVAVEQEETERKAELDRQRYEVEVHGTTPTATATQPSQPEPVPRQSDFNMRRTAVIDRLLELIDLKDRTEDLLKRGQDKLVDTEGKIRDQYQQLRLLRKEQALTNELKSAE